MTTRSAEIPGGVDFDVVIFFESRLRTIITLPETFINFINFPTHLMYIGLPDIRGGMTVWTD